MIQIEIDGSTAILWMNHGKVNAIDIDMFSEFMDRLEEAEKLSATSIVLTGKGKAFSAGVDLFQVLNGGREYLEKFLPLLVGTFEKLFLCSKPIIAAVNGHAIAGGSILACACDYRIAAKGDSKIGVPELLVGVPFPPLALEIMRFAVSSEALQEIVYTGRTYGVEQSLQKGMVDEIVSPELLLKRAIEMAMQFGRIPQQAFRMTKRQLRGPVIEKARQFGPSDEEILNEWSAPDTLEIIHGYLQKTIGMSSRQSPKDLKA
jgi:enoyl-CoA hydratase